MCLRKLSAAAVWPLVFACASTRPSGGEGTRVGSPGEMEEFLDQYARTYRFQLGEPRGVRIAPDGKILFLRSGPRSFVHDLYELDPRAGEERVLLTSDQILGGAEETLSDEERAVRERMRSSTKGIAGFGLSEDGTKLLVPLSGRLFAIDRQTLSTQQVGSASGFPLGPRISPDGKRVALVRDGDLYVIDLETGKERRLTERANDDESNGLAEFVAQEEMGRFEGLWWSPDSKRLAYQRTDNSKLEKMHIADPSAPASPPKIFPYPRAGRMNAEVRLGLIDVEGGVTTWVRWDRERFPYLATVKWPATGGPLTLAVENREQTELVLLRVAEETGSTKELLREKDEAWLNLDQSVPRWLPSGKGFVWCTERNGAKQLELRDPEGELLRPLTEPGMGLQKLIEVDEPRGVLVVNASRDPKESQLFLVPLDAARSPPTALTSEPGLHSAIWSSKLGIFVHTSHGLDGSSRVRVRSSDGAVIAEIASVAEEPALLPSLELLDLAGAEGRIFSAAVVRPRSFDPGRRYPVILSVYAGPGVTKVHATPQAFLLQQWMADHGFIVVSLDGRGTPGKSRSWERAIKGDFISVPLNDQVEGLMALGAKLPELDLGRVGVFGWSFGGYFSAMAVMLRPDIFKAGVAGAPVSEWLDYDTHYTERYLGLPDKAPEAYRRSSVLSYVDRLERPLLIIHGTSDDNVYFSHAIKLSDALFRAGKDHDFLALSGFTHMVPDPLVTKRLYEKILGFLGEHLGQAR